MILLKFDIEVKGGSKVEGHDTWIDTLNFNVDHDAWLSGRPEDR